MVTVGEERHDIGPEVQETFQLVKAFSHQIALKRIFLCIFRQLRTISIKLTQPFF
jgi:hypothetical protein